MEIKLIKKYLISSLMFGLLLLTSNAFALATITDLGELSVDNTKITTWQWTSFYNDVDAPTKSWNDDGDLNDGRFLHMYEFSVDESVKNNEIVGRVKSFEISWLNWELLGIDDLVVELIRASDEQVLFTGGNKDKFRMALGAGDFYLNIGGIADDVWGGKYKAVLKVTDTVVPLPPAALLFLSSLLGMGFVSRRKGASNQ